MVSQLAPHLAGSDAAAVRRDAGGGALLLSGYLDLQPCLLCLKQREWHWGVLGVSALALIVTRVRPGWTNWAIVIIGLVLLGSAAMAGYHVAVEHKWVVAQCDAGGALDPSQLCVR